ncbi:MAG: hypothetical protein IPI22_14115 [Bacteroidetes bacterium]|nr:hypothetical protein [Bacteroidota bacterium]
MKKKNNNNGGKAIKNENDTALARVLNRLENICFRKNSWNRTGETPSKPGK